MLIAVISEDAFPVHVNILMQVAGEYAGDLLLDKKSMMSYRFGM